MEVRDTEQGKAGEASFASDGVLDLWQFADVLGMLCLRAPVLAEIIFVFGLSQRVFGFNLAFR